MSITDDEFKYICLLIENKCGIELHENHHYLVESRLEPLVEKHGYHNISDMIAKMRYEKSDNPFFKAIVDAMTTNETLFFRDKHPYEYLKSTLIPEVMKQRQLTKKIRIWSAACSTGQEPYSIVMTFLENFPNCKDWQFEVTATDYSQNILEKAIEGYYSQFEVQRGLTEDYLKKYFTAENNGWRVNPAVKKHVRFSQANLIDPELNLGTFDIIFCRNVLIYFSGKTKGMVFQQLAKSLSADGQLILGGAESPNGFSDLWERKPGENSIVVYQKKKQDLNKLIEKVLKS